MQNKSYVLLRFSELGGVGNNDRVLEDMLFTRDFKISDEKYYLTNAGYHNKDYFLCPYRGVRYYFKEQAAASRIQESPAVVGFFFRGMARRVGCV